MDDQLRLAERAVRAGEPGAESLWRFLCARRGLYLRDRQPPEELTEWEEIQADYDDLWWQRKSVVGFKWTSGCRCCFEYGNKFANKLVKGKDQRNRSNWGDNNAKRKTLRTHRDGSRRAYRLRPHRTGGEV